MAVKKFGGEWTTEKLEILQKYLSAYTTVLRNKPCAARPFRLLYIDAFAGTGHLDLKSNNCQNTAPYLFPEGETKEAQQFMDGSARVSLKITHPFNQYIFMEKTAKGCAQLLALRDEFPQLGKKIRVEQGDCNEIIRTICQQYDWKRTRAVIFLDPFGMQVDWNTIEQISATKAMDLWLLFPISAVNRMLTSNGEMPESWAQKLESFFGTTNWKKRFYSEERQPSLFDLNKTTIHKDTSFKDIGEFMTELKDLLSAKEGS